MYFKYILVLLFFTRAVTYIYHCALARQLMAGGLYLWSVYFVPLDKIILELTLLDRTVHLDRTGHFSDLLCPHHRPSWLLVLAGLLGSIYPMMLRDIKGQDSDKQTYLGSWVLFWDVKSLSLSMRQHDHVSVITLNRQAKMKPSSPGGPE